MKKWMKWLPAVPVTVLFLIATYFITGCRDREPPRSVKGRFVWVDRIAMDNYIHNVWRDEQTGEEYLLPDRGGVVKLEKKTASPGRFGCEQTDARAGADLRQRKYA